MRSRVVLLLGALERPGEPPLFDGLPEALRRLSRRGEIFRVRVRSGGVPEAEWLGLAETPSELSQGVLTVAALGADPPERSTHFHLSLLTMSGNALSLPEFALAPEEANAVFAQLRRLETSKLKLVEGRGLDHALVWEDGSLDLQCVPPQDAVELGFEQSLPEGDGEKMLRRFIDDSVNLLHELELNEIRGEEGLPPLNLAWPWGPGFRPKLPNLVLERGMSVAVQSSSVRLRGLCRLVGYRHGDPWAIGRGTNLRLEEMAKTLTAAPFSLAAIGEIGEFRAQGKWAEAEWLSREVVDRVLEPLADEPDEEPQRVLVVATQREGDGLALRFDSANPVAEGLPPFDVEALEDPKIGGRDFAEAIAEALTPQ